MTAQARAAAERCIANPPVRDSPVEKLAGQRPTGSRFRAGKLLRTYPPPSLILPSVAGFKTGQVQSGAGIPNFVRQEFRILSGWNSDILGTRSQNSQNQRFPAGRANCGNIGSALQAVPSLAPWAIQRPPVSRFRKEESPCPVDSKVTNRLPQWRHVRRRRVTPERICSVFETKESRHQHRGQRTPFGLAAFSSSGRSI